MMKTKLRTFARKQILCKPIDTFLWKKDLNMVFTWLKHGVKPVGLYENTFIQILWYIFCYNVI